MPTSLDGHHHLLTPHATVEAQQTSQVDAALASFPAILRPLAARTMRTSTFYCDDYRITVTELAFSVTCDARATLVRPWSGEEVPLEIDGRTIHSYVKRDGPAVALRLVSDAGTRTTHYAPTTSGIHVDVTLQSSHLDAPIRWALDYATVP